MVLVPEGIQRGYFCSLSALGLGRGLWPLSGNRATVGCTICPYPNLFTAYFWFSRLGHLAGFLLATCLGFRVLWSRGFFPSPVSFRNYRETVSFSLSLCSDLLGGVLLELRESIRTSGHPLCSTREGVTFSHRPRGYRSVLPLHLLVL